MCRQEVFTFYLPQNTPFKTASLLILGYLIQQQQEEKKKTQTLSLGIFDISHIQVAMADRYSSQNEAA